MIENLSYTYKPKTVYIIGNAFGWSTIIFSLAFSNSKILAIDAGIEGKDNLIGIKLTNDIIKTEKFNSFVEYGCSPIDNKKYIGKHFGINKLDLVFIDGLHTNEQILKDFYGVLDFCHDKTIFLFHDVVNWGMEKSFNKICNYLRDKDYESRLLYRTTSGMGCCYPLSLNREIKCIFNYFSEKEGHILRLKNDLKMKMKMKRSLRYILPINFIKLIKKVIK